MKEMMMALKCPNCKTADTAQKPQILKAGKAKGREHWQCKKCKFHWDRPAGTNGPWK